MSGMTVPGRAVQVLSLIDNQHSEREARLLKLDTLVLRDITGKVDKEGHPLAVIVIAGPERQGKSFILSYFVRYLQALEKSADGVVGDWMEKSDPEISMKDRGFNFENAFERTTEGIWMWSRPFIIPKPSNPDKKIAVLLMDTEGCYGSSLTNQEQAALVGLSLLTSSVFIYNETTRINDSTLATVGKFMQYEQLASQTFQGKIFHRIMFLIRDWNSPNTFEYGAAGGQGFIREFFREKPGMTKEAVEYRNAIMKHFEDCNAYLVPHPGQAVLSRKFSGSVAEMTPEFSYHLENFVTNLIADVGPKMLRDNFVTGSSFVSLFQASVKAFNASDMPSPASILKATLYQQHQFLQKTEGLEKLRTKLIPQCGKEWSDRMEDKIRKNPFISEAAVDVILREEFLQVQHSLIIEVKSENTLNSIEFRALVDEVENHFEKTKKEVKQKLRMERDQGDENAESIYQSVLDFAMTELSRVVEILIDGCQKNMEEEFQTLKSHVDAKFEDAWPYEPCNKKDSIKRNIHSKLDDELGIARREVPKKMSEETKCVAESMESVLSSFARTFVQVLDGGKYISMGKLEVQLVRDVDLKMQEFQALLLLNQVKFSKHIGEMTQRFKDRKREILQINTENLLKIVSGAEGLIRTHYVQSGPRNTFASLDQLFTKTQTAVTAFLAENCYEKCDDALRTSLLQSIKGAHEASIRKLGGETGAMVKYCQGAVAEDDMDVLLALADEAIDVYENSVKQFEMGQSIERRKDMFKDNDQAARSQALQNFEAGTSRVHGFPWQHHYCLKELMKRLDNATNNRWASIVQEETRITEEQARKVLEQTRIAQEEDNRRKKEEADKQEREHRRQLAHTEIRSPLPGHNENLNENQDVGDRQQWRLTGEDDGKKPCDPRAQCAGASSVATNNSIGFNWIFSHEEHNKTSLPSVELAIHMGLHHTQVAFITPATGKFNSVANVRNRLYWNEHEHELTPAFDEALPSDRPVIDFERDLALPKDRGYDFTLCQRQFSWDLQDVLSQFLICLKRKAEMNLRMEFNTCVVAVPQFLNDSQRMQVRQSAIIAGFDHVTFVNDTTAVAVVHMVDEQAIKGNVVVVNTQEGPIDVASYVFDHGNLECHGVTGHYFTEDQTSFFMDAMDVTKESLSGFPKNSAQNFFTQNELAINLSSPSTKFLLLGKGEDHDLCVKAIRKATNYAKDDIHDIQPETVVYGTAFICCLRSRDPCNSILLKWHHKLQPSSETVDNKVLNEVEQKILRPERSLKKNMNMTTGYLLTSEEAQQRRTKLNTNMKAVHHRDRLEKLQLINSMEK